MAQYRNLLFDLGGIFIDIDYGKTKAAFEQLGIEDFDALYAQHHANPLFESLETGEIEPAAFYDGLRQSTGLDHLTNAQMEAAWNAMLGPFPPERMAWLRRLSKSYRLFLFSNTNAIHHAAFTQIFRVNNPEGPAFDQHFERVFYSHEAGFRKPYPESYTKLLEMVSIPAEDTLFIDDTAVNIAGAKAAGLHTHLLLKPATVLDLDL